MCSYGNEVLTVAGKGVVEEQLLEKRRGCAGVNVWGHNVVALNGKPSMIRTFGTNNEDGRSKEREVHSRSVTRRSVIRRLEER